MFPYFNILKIIVLLYVDMKEKKTLQNPAVKINNLNTSVFNALSNKCKHLQETGHPFLLFHYVPGFTLTASS